MPDFFPSRWREDRPPSLEKFTSDFPDDFACAEYLAKKRWAKGFKCPHCGGTEAWRLAALRCSRRHIQTSFQSCWGRVCLNRWFQSAPKSG